MKVFFITALSLLAVTMTAVIADPTSDVTMLPWEELDPLDRTVLARTFGWNKYSWRAFSRTLRWYYILEWYMLGKDRQENLKKLGWTREMWRKNRPCHGYKPVVESKPFSRLTPEERAIARGLGYNEYTWHVKELKHRNMRPITERDYYNKTETVQDENYGFTPFVVKMDVPELGMFTWNKLKQRDDIMFDADDNTVTGENGNDEHNQKTYSMSMKEFVERILAGEKLYVKYENEKQKDIIDVLDGVNPADAIRSALEKAAPPELLALGNFGLEHPAGTKELVEYAMLYIGGNGTTTNMHLDYLGFNFLWVVQGRKRVVLYPNDPRTATQLTSGLQANYSFWPGKDILTHPLPPHAVEFILGPGEGVHIPYFTWHAVENLEPTIAFGLMQDYTTISTPMSCFYEGL